MFSNIQYLFPSFIRINSVLASFQLIDHFSSNKISTFPILHVRSLCDSISVSIRFWCHIKNSTMIIKQGKIAYNASFFGTPHGESFVHRAALYQKSYCDHKISQNKNIKIQAKREVYY